MLQGLMTPEQARTLKTELDAASQQVGELTAGMDAGALTKRATNGGWSVAENLQHLILTAESMEPLLEEAIVELERTGQKASSSSSLGVLGWLLVRSLEPPPRVKTKTIPAFVPGPDSDPLSLASKLQESHARLEILIARAKGLATSRVRVTSPFNARVKYNLYAAFRIILAHTRRHLSQARAAKV